MSDVLVLVEHSNGVVAKVTTELLTAARSVGNPVAVLVGASGDAAKAQGVLAEFGATAVLAAEGDEFLVHPVAPVVDVLEAAAKARGAAFTLIASSAKGKEIAGRFAVRTNSGVITDAVALDSDGSTTQSIFGGSTVVKAAVIKGAPVITMRPNATAPVAAAASPSIEMLSVQLSPVATAAKVSSREAAVKGGRPELTEAAIVVSGGRGTNGDFSAVENFADTLGAAVGASRAATDAGWYPHSFQVGQTGKTVSPNLYVACGISGAIQHRAGMQTSKTIVAINKDPEAPIFEIADFGVVGDLFAVLPQATEATKSRKG